MDGRRAKAGETVLFTADLHWVTLSPAILCVAVAGAVQNWGTSGLVERLGWDALPEQVIAITGADLDLAITLLAFLMAAPALGRGIARMLFTHFLVTSTGVRWEQRGLRSHEVSAGFQTIESVQVEQGLLGRLLGYGTINVVGRNAVGRRRRISRPDAFRKAFNDQMSTWLCRDLSSGPRPKKFGTG